MLLGFRELTVDGSRSDDRLCNGDQQTGKSQVTLPLIPDYSNILEDYFRKPGMPVTVRRSSEMAVAFRLGVGDIEKLSCILSVLDDRCSCSIRCSDGLTREYDSVKDALAYENSPAKQIQDLEIAVRSKNYEAYAELQFCSSRFNSIKVRLNGPEEIVSKISNNLDDFFPRITTWYRFIARVEFALMSAFIISTFLILGLITSGKIGSSDTRTTAETVLLYISAPGCVFIFSSIISRFQDWIFPMAEFAIGQGFQRDAHRERLRRGVIGIIVVPSILSGLGLLIRKIVG
jgi:hypothetical protein